MLNTDGFPTEECKYYFQCDKRLFAVADVHIYVLQLLEPFKVNMKPKFTLFTFLIKVSGVYYIRIICFIISVIFNLNEMIFRFC